MSVALAPSPADAFLDALGRAEDRGPLAAIRRQGRERFAESGFPTRRNEAWRFTELKPLIEARFAAPSSVETPDDDLEEADRLVFVDGRLVAAQSRIGTLPAGVVIGSFVDWARGQADPAALFDLAGGTERTFVSLNAAYFTDGAAIVVPDGVELTRPIRLVHWNTGAAVHVKSLVRLGRGAQATIIESFAGTGLGWTNAAVAVELGDGARLGRYAVQDESSQAFHTAHLALTLGAHARHDGFLLSLGGRIARQDVRATLAGAHAYCAYSGAYLLRGRQESTVASVIEHAAVSGVSRQVFKGCLADRSHGVFQGKIRVAPAGQKTDGYQLNKTMMLGERAVMDTKPELEIHADDVKCSHGATVGDLDEAALFYLRSRGIETDPARMMLIEAFVQDAIDQVEDEAARAWLGRAVAHRLGRA